MKSGIKPSLVRRMALALLLAPMVAVAAVDLANFDADVMKAMDDAFKDLEPVLGASNAVVSKENVAVLKDGYQWTLEYFGEDRGAPEATRILTAGLSIVGDVERAVAAGDYGAAVLKARELQSNCKSCHDKYKPKKQQ